jgi:predicted transcriptional regulator
MEEILELLECKICGLKSKCLTRHIPCKHNITCDEYRKLYNVKKE